MSTSVKSVKNKESDPPVQIDKEWFPGYTAKDKSKLWKNIASGLAKTRGQDQLVLNISQWYKVNGQQQWPLSGRRLGAGVSSGKETCVRCLFLISGYLYHLHIFSQK